MKPHASPIFHAIQYLMGNQTREKLENFRGYKGVQSYPSRTKDVDDVDFSTGSVGMGVAQTLFSSLVQDYLKARNWAPDLPEGRMVALIGDAEMDEGNIFEALLEGWKHGLRNTWWIVDYNRQSLDAVIREGLWERLEGIFRNFGWDVVILKHGQIMLEAFKEPGGEALRNWIDSCPNQLYSALTFQGGAAWRKRLMDDLGDQGPVSRLIESRSDEQLARLMGNLGGHDLPSLTAAFENARKHDRPVCFIAYTIKGFGLPLAGHKDNHSGLLTPAQMDAFRDAQNIRARPRMGPVRRSAPGRGQAVRLPRQGAVLRQGTPPLLGSGRPGAGRVAGPGAEGAVHPGRLRPHHERAGTREGRSGRPHRDDRPRRHRLDQPGFMGQPARAVRQGGHGRPVQEGTHPLDL